MSYRIDRNKLEVLRAKLIQRLGRDVSWNEFSAIVGVSITTISGIRHERSNGSGHTGQQIIDNLAKHGILVSHDDLVSPSDEPSAHPLPKRKKSHPIAA